MGYELLEILENFAIGLEGLSKGHTQEICSKKRNITVDARSISMLISISLFSRTGKSIPMHRS